MARTCERFWMLGGNHPRGVIIDEGTDLWWIQNDWVRNFNHWWLVIIVCS